MSALLHSSTAGRGGATAEPLLVAAAASRSHRTLHGGASQAAGLAVDGASGHLKLDVTLRFRLAALRERLRITPEQESRHDRLELRSGFALHPRYTTEGDGRPHSLSALPPPFAPTLEAATSLRRQGQRLLIVTERQNGGSAAPAPVS